MCSVNATANFLNQVSVHGGSPNGTLFTNLTLSFAGNGIAGASAFTFQTGVDYASPFTGSPEPASFLLAGGGLIGLAMLRHRRRA